MIADWFAPTRSGAEVRVRRESSYECSHCRTAVDEWTEDCPHCCGLVVRVVEPVDSRPARP